MFLIFFDCVCSFWSFLSFIIRYQWNFQESYVLRVYDNRVRSTSRSPYLYLLNDDDNPLKDDYSVKNGSVKKVLTFVDGGDKDVLEFGKKPITGNHPKAQGWMLFGGNHVCFKGQIQIIAVRYYEGEHVCRTIGQACDIVDKVAKLHAKKIVHGDIRGCNLVFSEKGSHLIDLDFGGKVGDVMFPPGYKTFLPDGMRFFAGDGEPISEEHDSWAVWSVLFDHHKFIMNENDLRTASENKPDQHALIIKFLEMEDKDDEIMGMNDLFEVLKLVNEWDKGARFHPKNFYRRFLNSLKAGRSPENNGKAAVATAPGKVLNNMMKKKKETPKVAQFSPFGLLVKASPRNYKYFLPQAQKRRRVNDE